MDRPVFSGITGCGFGKIGHLISGEWLDHPALTLEPVKQTGAWRRLKHPHHGHNDSITIVYSY